MQAARPPGNGGGHAGAKQAVPTARRRVKPAAYASKCTSARPMGPNSAVTVSPGRHWTTSAALPVVTTWPALQGQAAPAQVVGEPDHDVPRVAEDVGSCALAHHLAAHAHQDPLAGEVLREPALRRGPEAEQAADGVVGDQVLRLHGEPVAVARIRDLDGGVDARDRGPDLGLRIGRGTGPERAAHDEVELRLDGVEVHAACRHPQRALGPRNRRTGGRRRECLRRSAPAPARWWRRSCSPRPLRPALCTSPSCTA